MAGAAAAARVAVEVFMERNQVPPMWIVVEKLAIAEDGPLAFASRQKDAGHRRANSSATCSSSSFARAGRTLHLKLYRRSKDGTASVHS